MPVAGNLYHHAIEMLLKARLSDTRSLEVLSRRPFGHCLQALWNAFKAEFPGVGLAQFDGTITTLDPFWDLRYPDTVIQEGAQIFFQWTPGISTSTFAPGITPPPRYDLVVTDIDSLVARIFEVSSRNLAFFMNGMNEYARNAITLDNPVCAGWFSRG